MIGPEQPADLDGVAFSAMASALRPQLHRYCARLTGSVIDGEDVVQDTLAKALAALESLAPGTPLRPWLFRIAHNRALDLMRSRTVRAAEPLDAAAQTPDAAAPDPLEVVMRQEAVRTAVGRFVELPTTQRSVVILKDVPDHSLGEIADLLDLTLNAVKAHLARGRARLTQINAQAAARGGEAVAGTASAAAVRYAALFNQRDWDGLRAMLADDVRLNQATYPARAGAADVGRFFSIYDGFAPVRMAPAWLEGREVMAVFQTASAAPDYFMWLEWRGDRIAFIHDYRYARYVLDGANLRLATPSSQPVLGAPN